MINSRDTEDVVKWLKLYKNLQVVSRDGSVSYKSAIQKANENIITGECKDGDTAIIDCKSDKTAVATGEKRLYLKIKKNIRNIESTQLQIDALPEPEIVQ